LLIRVSGDTVGMNFGDRAMTKTVCYCFNYSDTDIENDVRLNNGRSLILERIAKAKREHTVSARPGTPKNGDA
jgi:hypothetical protein